MYLYILYFYLFNFYLFFLQFIFSDSSQLLSIYYIKYLDVLSLNCVLNQI